MLSTFAFQGGIERFNRALLYALNSLSEKLNFTVTASVVYDDSGIRQNYFPSEKLESYDGRRIFFFIKESMRLFRNDIWILGHLNLSPLGLLRKLIRPSMPVILICHGIEVFTPVKGFKRRMLQKADGILAVSQYTKDQLIHLHHIPEEKITVFPNTIDPFFQLPVTFEKPDSLKKRYHISDDEKVIFTLTRMNAGEGYKGYDRVLQILPSLLEKGISVRYILAGKADDSENTRILSIINKLCLEKTVILPGFISEDEITAHYLLADLFVMPSKGEGFGIVFLEAMACGLPVISGNKDGSTEALQFGKLGTLVDPDDIYMLAESVKKGLLEKKDPSRLQKEMLSFFSFDAFTRRTENQLISLFVNT